MDNQNLASELLLKPSFPYRFRTWVVAQSGWRRACVAFAAGSVSVLAFAPFFLSPLLFLTFPCLFWLIGSSANSWRAASSTWWFAFGYFFFNLFWIGEAFLVEADKFAVLLPFAVTLLPGGLALFWALSGAVVRKLWPPGTASIFVFVLVFSIAEWLRGHLFTGLPWNIPGYALTYPLPLMQSAALFGVYGLTPLAFLVFTWPLAVLSQDARPLGGHIVRAWAVAAVPVLVLWAYGSWRLAGDVAFVPNVKLRIVQPSVPQREKWLPQFQRRIFEDHLALSLTSPAGTPDNAREMTHIVWPEAAMPFFPLEQPEALRRIGEMLAPGRVLITGAIRRDLTAIEPGARRNAYNSLIAFDDAGRAVAIYDKVRLVPFGEYLPFEPLLRAAGLLELAHGLGSFGSGPEPRPLFRAPGLPPAAGLICYEALFPGAVSFAETSPQLIFNVTNDGWFGNTSGPRQHFYQTRVRAVESGLPLIRAANNGISAVIDPYGRVLQSLGMDARGTIDSSLPAPLITPPYARFGDIAFSLILAALAVLGVRTTTKTTR